MPLDLVRLRSFLEVAERGTVAAAADALGYTAPAVSQHVAKLERDLGVALFDRVGGQLRLARSGAALVPLATEMVHLARRAGDVVREPAPRERVKVAGLASAIAALITPRLGALGDGVTLEIVEAEDTAALRELRLGHADVALVQEYPDDDLARDPRLAYTVAARDGLRLVLPPGLPVTTTIGDLATTPWLLNGTGTRCAAATRQLVQAAGIAPEIRGDVSDNQTLLGLVAAGHGVTVVPDLVLAGSHATVTIAAQSLGVERTLLAVTRRIPSPPVRMVIDTIATTGSESPMARRRRHEPSGPHGPHERGIAAVDVAWTHRSPRPLRARP